MKQGIHPTWYPQATVTCSCGNSWTTGSTEPEIHTDICSACHPFYTGEQRIVDTAGQVDRFMKRLRSKEAIRAQVRSEAEQRRREEEAARKARARGDDPETSVKKVRQASTEREDETEETVEA